MEKATRAQEEGRPVRDACDGGGGADGGPAQRRHRSQEGEQRHEAPQQQQGEPVSDSRVRLSNSKPHLKVQEVNRVRERLYIQLKLFVVMGLPWMFEPISWAVDSSPAVTAALPFSTCWVWLVTDLVNMLQVSWIYTA